MYDTASRPELSKPNTAGSAASPRASARRYIPFALSIAATAALSAAIWASSKPDAAEADNDANAMSTDLDRGAPGLARCLAELGTRASLLMITAHPDDEDGGLLAYYTRGLGARGALLTLTRGEGGQNEMSSDLYDALGLVRTEELLASDRYYGVDQYWSSVIDYGFSKTREEALDKWGHDRVLSDVVRILRMTRPLIIVSVFAGAPTDGHGNHQVSGEVAQEAFLAAGDPMRFPEQLREGLKPWTPLKVYARVPFFSATKEGMYDYATDKYVPVKFFDYVHQTWMYTQPSTDVEIAEGDANPPSGLTFLQIGRQGWGCQKSQNGGATIPPPVPYESPYHRYGSRVAEPKREESLYDGIDISLQGVAGLASGDTEFLKQGLARMAEIVTTARKQFHPEDPTPVAVALAEGLNDTRALLAQVQASNLPEPGKSNVAFELENKERQFERALILALGLSFDVRIAPEHEPSGPFARFSSAPTFANVIPGQSFAVNAHLMNGSPETVDIEGMEVTSSDGKNWKIQAHSSPATSLKGRTDTSAKFSLIAPADAALTRPYFSRPNLEQPYYDLTDKRYRNLSLPPYPLTANVRIAYRGAHIEIRKVVQATHRIEGIGLESEPLLVAPAISITVSPAAGAVPLDANSFTFSCTLHSNVKGPAQGTLRLDLPQGWQSTPAEYPFSLDREDANDTVRFQVAVRSLQAGTYNVKAIATYKGETFHEGYRLVGYAGLRPYPLYRDAVYKAVGVDVKTAPALHLAYLPGTGDDVVQALEDLGLSVRTLSSVDIDTADLSTYDGIILGVRAYAVQPVLATANNRLLSYVKNGGTLLVQYNLQNFDRDYGPYPFTLGQNPQKVVDETSAVKLLSPSNPILDWPNRISEADFKGWEEERGHGFLASWDAHYVPLLETHDPDQDPQRGGLLVARYGRGTYIYDAFALYRQLPAGVSGAYRLLANLVSVGKNQQWKEK